MLTAHATLSTSTLGFPVRRRRYFIALICTSYLDLSEALTSN